MIRLLVNNELERARKEAVMREFLLLTRNVTGGPTENYVFVPVEERQSSNRPTVTIGVHASSLWMQKAMTYRVHTHYIQHIHYACGYAYVTVTSNWPPYIHSLTQAQYRSDLKMSLTEMWSWIKPLDWLKQYRNTYKKMNWTYRSAGRGQ